MTREKAHAETFPLTVAVASKGSFHTADSRRTFETRQTPLFTVLRELGARGVGLNGAEDKVERATFGAYYDLSKPGEVVRVEEPITVMSARDLTGGIARYVPEVPALNPRGVRDIVASKADQYAALAELGEAVARTIVCDANEQAIGEALDLMGDVKVVVKADKDPSKKHVMLIGSKNEISSSLPDLLATVPPTQKILIQEYMDDINSEFDPNLDIHSYDKEKIANTRALGREVRVHVIDGEPIAAHGRVGMDPRNKSPLDDWVFFEQQSLPAHARELAATAAKLIHARGGAIDSYLAVDLTPNGRRVVEVNGRNTGTMKPSAHPGEHEVHTIVTHAVANKLVTMAKREG